MCPRTGVSHVRRRTADGHRAHYHVRRLLQTSGYAPIVGWLWSYGQAVRAVLTSGYGATRMNAKKVRRNAW
eukprot:3297497-Rhodomonas_salina.1